MKSSDKIKEVGNQVINMLLEKNKAYGDSALKPANIFARGSAVDNLCSRIDDKLMRIKNKGISDETEDTINDLIGYLILLKISIQDEHIGQPSNDIQNSQGRRESVLSNYWTSTRTYTERQE